MSDLYLLLAVAVILGVVVVAFLLVVLQRLKRRRQQLMNDLTSPPRQAGDRAFNRLDMARREAAILDRQGTDTARARDLIAQSQAAFDQMQYSRSYELAQSAHEALVHARQGAAGAPTTATSAAPPATTRLGTGIAATAATATATAMVTPVTALAPNRAESQFQIRLLDADLEGAASGRATPSEIAAASTFRSQAQGSFDRGQYTDALRFALKGRRELGGKVETLASGTAAASAGTLDAPLDLATAAERAAGAARCPQCGYPARPDDSFCRGCGTPRVPSVCGQCGAPRTTADTFCGRCGARFT